MLSTPLSLRICQRKANQRNGGGRDRLSISPPRGRSQEMCLRSSKALTLPCSLASAPTEAWWEGRDGTLANSFCYPRQLKIHCWRLSRVAPGKTAKQIDIVYIPSASLILLQLGSTTLFTGESVLMRELWAFSPWPVGKWQQFAIQAFVARQRRGGGYGKRDSRRRLLRLGNSEPDTGAVGGGDQEVGGVQERQLSKLAKKNPFLFSQVWLV